MTEISATETIMSRQLKLLEDVGVKEVIITTGYFEEALVNYCNSLEYNLCIGFVNNPLYADTNYIYSIYCARELLRDEDVLLMHDDLVFEYSVLEDLINNEKSCMKVSSVAALPEKDFKAVVTNGLVTSVGIEFFDSAMEAQAFYKLNKEDWNAWLEEICNFCELNNCKCYAEVALNNVISKCSIEALDVKERLCTEIDNVEDLAIVKSKLFEIEN